MDNTQLYQPPQRDNLKFLKNPLLLIVFGIALGAMIISVFIFFYLENKAEDKKNTGEAIEEIKTEINASLQEELKKSFSVVFGRGSIADIYTIEKENGLIAVSAVANLSKEQFAEVFKINANEIDPEYFKNVVLIILAEYVQENGVWVLKKDIKAYQGIDLVLMQESLNTAQEESWDFIIKSEMSAMRVMAEIWGMDGEDSYSWFCESPDAHEAIDRVAIVGQKVLCKDSDSKWAAFASLYNTTDQCYCVDYQGTSKSLNSPCPSKAVTTCP